MQKPKIEITTVLDEIKELKETLKATSMVGVLKLMLDDELDDSQRLCAEGRMDMAYGISLALENVLNGMTAKDAIENMMKDQEE